MSHPTTNPTYEPLPLTNDDNIGRGLYNDPYRNGPPSPGLHTPMMSSTNLPDNDLLPTGAAQPRFLGHAAYSDAPEMRHSLAGSSHTVGQSEYNSSVYNLNEHGAVPLSYRDDPGSNDGYPMASMGQSRHLNEKRAVYAAPRSKRKVIIWAIIISAILLIAAVLIPLYFAVIRPKLNNNDGEKKADNPKASGTDKTNGKPVTNAIVTGGDGSKVKTETGEEFTYENKFGGHWYWDENDPFNNGARPQSWSPGLNETFRYGIDKIRGVNLGGWLTLEPFISPAMFELYLDRDPPAIDEWTLHTYLAQDTARGGFKQLEDHYKTFITEKDFAEIAAAGLNFVRLPLPFWAIETKPNEPFLPKVAWTYFLKGVQWARKYGIRIKLDLHALPGSQNGWNHSGKWGTINLLQGPMGIANAQRTLDIIRVVAQFISQPQYKDVIPLYGIMNEPQGQQSIGKDPVTAFNYQAYETIRNISGTGEGKGPYIVYSDAFFGRSEWVDFIPNGDRLVLDSHPYICFGPQSDKPMDTYATRPCDEWGASFNSSLQNFGLTVAGEFSNAVTDCGLWLTGVNEGTRYEGDYIRESGFPRIGNCSRWTDYKNFSPAHKAAMKQFALASMDALQNYFFWTWKIGNSSRTGKVEAPEWSYQLGLQEGWMPTDPRDATGVCGGGSPFRAPLKPYQTGGAGAGNIPANLAAQYPWPPASLVSAGLAPTDLPQYTPTGVVPTLPGPTFSFPSATATPDVGNGWFNPSDTAGAMVEKQGCPYLDPWVGTAAPAPPACTN